RSSAWPERSGPSDPVARPWDPPETIAATVAAATKGILDRNAEGVATLRRLADEGALFYEGGEVHRAPVRITYFVGNHDWMLRLPGPAYDAVRAHVVSALGLAHEDAGPFPHAPEEAPGGLTERLLAHRLVVRHGDVFDSINFPGDRNRAALGDAIVVELLNRFPELVRRHLGLAADDPLYLALREIDNVRPFSTIPPWVLGVIRRFGLEGKRSGRSILEVWDGLGEAFFALDFVREQDRRWRLDDVDRLEAGFRFVKAFVSSRARRAIVGGLLRLVADRNREFARHALLEPAVQAGEARYVAYGHTHVHQLLPLAVRRDEPVGKQFYFNSGTWRPTYRQTVGHPERLEFLGHNALTVLAFYAGDERAGRGFEVWNGALEGPA
ncbi:MAG: hypothetical protein ABR599_08020, partial [Gemmatimonadota bacterium]